MSLQDKLSSHNNDRLSAEKKAGSDFLAKNKTEEGVVELPGGIQYKILQEGNGPKPELRSTIKAHYAGRLLNGKEFDSSYRRNQPFSAPITSLIKGWQEVLPMMPVGSKWTIWTPSDLAYGDRGTGGIPGGAVLNFDIELLEIVR
jgi:FKBP-type peptidyl-prolyl cis-trans isomerase FklB